jgi:hypothetical protein
VKKLSPKTVIAYFATWDERIGPVIVDCYPPITNLPDLDIENINLQIYTSLQTVFGNVRFDPISYTLPLKFAKRLVRIHFNPIISPIVRGGILPILSVILLPLEYPEEQTYRFNSLQDKITKSYSPGRSIKMEKYFTEMSVVVENVAKDLKQEGDRDYEQRRYFDAIKHYEVARVLLESIDKDISILKLHQKNRRSKKRLLPPISA